MKLKTKPLKRHEAKCSGCGHIQRLLKQGQMIGKVWKCGVCSRYQRVIK